MQIRYSKQDVSPLARGKEYSGIIQRYSWYYVLVHRVLPTKGHKEAPKWRLCCPSYIITWFDLAIDTRPPFHPKQPSELVLSLQPTYAPPMPLYLETDPREVQLTFFCRLHYLSQQDLILYSETGNVPAERAGRNGAQKSLQMSPLRTVRSNAFIAKHIHVWLSLLQII